MTDKAKLPVHRLELTSGVYRITTSAAIYEIRLTADGMQAKGVHEIVESDYKSASGDSAEAQPIIVEDSFYRDISEEMLQEIGKLARQLSISIKTPVDGDTLKTVDLKKAGIDLETAKHQLQDIVAMTETATMTIMDISDGIQESCNTIRKNLEEITGLSFVNTNELPEPEPKDGSIKSVRETMAGIMKREEQMKNLLKAVAADIAQQASGTPHKGMTEALTFIDNHLGMLGTELDAFKDVYYGTREDYSVIRREDHDKLVRAVTSTDNVIHHIITNLNRILESLSFQDLSGQRIMRILSMLSNVQVQLLSILVSYGVKLKKRQEARGVSPKEADEVANREVDRIKTMITETSPDGSEWGDRLDQNAVDKLLADLGF
jgi:chemotaxis regulatin CheY-phosphate phosphatase CheZ